MAKPKRKTRTRNTESPEKKLLELCEIRPLTKSQDDTFKAYDEGYNLVLHGFPGTGKSFVGLYLALDEVLNKKTYEKVILIRSVVSARDIGFLPGSIKEKTAVFEEPYKEIVGDLCGRGDAYDLLKQKGIIDFATTSYLRGKTFNDAIVIFDEMQNGNGHELDTVITRMGRNSKIIFCGDFRQTDLHHDREKAGLTRFLKVLNRMKIFRYIDFQKHEIVRSGLVKDYIIAKVDYQDEEYEDR